ncbi:MAG: 50S ribosomal protein L14e, partial [Candidatus Hadarchaeota archaeon]|nr:50S ribosomal protein L14e [Candidatus Hadarchaeota archaeon]
MEVGQVCVKLAGREAGKKCVVVDVVDENYVLVSGPEVKRRRCNIGHLEPLEQKLEVKKGASDEDVKRALEGEKAKPEVEPEEPRE